MSNHKKNEHLEKIKSVVHKSSKLSADEKSDAIQTIESWIVEDRALGLLYKEFEKLSAKLNPILKEAGLG